MYQHAPRTALPQAVIEVFVCVEASQDAAFVGVAPCFLWKTIFASWGFEFLVLPQRRLELEFDGFGLSMEAVAVTAFSVVPLLPCERFTKVLCTGCSALDTRAQDKDLLYPR
jgi:hypothetical protein